MLTTAILISIVSLSFAYTNEIKASKLNATWKDCTSANAVGSISTVTITPNPPIIGANWTIVGMGSVTENVMNGSYTLNVKSGVIVDDTIKGSICQPDFIQLPANLGDVYYNGHSCPINKGSLSITMVAYVSSIAPTGQVLSTLTAYDQPEQKGNEMFCVEIITDVS